MYEEVLLYQFLVGYVFDLISQTCGHHRIEVCWGSGKSITAACFAAISGLNFRELYPLPLLPITKAGNAFDFRFAGFFASFARYPSVNLGVVVISIKLAFPVATGAGDDEITTSLTSAAIFDDFFPFE